PPPAGPGGLFGLCEDADAVPTRCSAALPLRASGHRGGAATPGGRVACTADGLVSTSVVRRWAMQFPTGLPALPPVPIFRSQAEMWTLREPAESRVPDPTQEDPWARSPPRQP